LLFANQRHGVGFHVLQAWYKSNFFGIKRYKILAIFYKPVCTMQHLIAIHLGRQRVAIKKHLAKEMKEIDSLVGKVVG